MPSPSKSRKKPATRKPRPSAPRDLSRVYVFVGTRKGGTVFVVPELSDEYRSPPAGKFRVYRSRNGGQRWQALTNGRPPVYAISTALVER